MKDLSISPSLLDAFAYALKEEEQGKGGWHNLLQYLKGEQQPTPAMQLGRIVDKVLQHGSKIAQWSRELDRYVINTADPDHPPVYVAVEPGALHDLLKVQQQHKTLAKQFSVNYHFQLPDKRQVRMRMRCDAVDGVCVHEYKTSQIPLSFSRYYDSWQWRCYLLGTGCLRAEYHVFQIQTEQEGAVTLLRQAKLLPVIKLFAYDELAADVQRACANLAQIFEEKGWISYIELS